jgi:hypothetical protein
MANYTPASGDVVIPGAQAATELLSRTGGFIAGCGEASLAVVSGIVNGTPVSPAAVSAIIQDAMNHGAGPGGVSTPAELQATARDYGVNLQSVPWQSALAQDAGSVPVELLVGNATAFGGADANVHGHYVTVVGRAANGSYIVSDPNTAASIGGGFVTYTAQQIANARPSWAGVPGGTVAGATYPGLNGAAQTVSSAGIPQAITSFGQTIAADATRGAQLVGWGVLALVIVGAGLWLLIPPSTKQAASDAVTGVASHAAELAAVAA